MKWIKTSLILLIGLILMSIVVTAITFKQEQTGNFNGLNSSITSCSERRYMGTLFTANRTYNLCGLKLRTNPSVDSVVNLTLWDDLGNYTPNVILKTFATDVVYDGTLYTTYQGENCYEVVNGTKYWLMMLGKTGDCTATGVLTGGTGYVDSAGVAGTPPSTAPPIGWRTGGAFVNYGIEFYTYSGIINSLSVNWNGQSALNASTQTSPLTTFYFNFSIEPIGNIANCSFYENNTLIETKNNLLSDTRYNFTIFKPFGYFNTTTNYISCSGNNTANGNSTAKIIYYNVSKGIIPTAYNPLLPFFINTTLSPVTANPYNCQSNMANGSSCSYTYTIQIGANATAGNYSIFAYSTDSSHNSTMFEVFSGSRYATITLSDKYPDDITSLNPFSSLILFNYTYEKFGTNNIYLDTNSIRLNYKLNDSTHSCVTFQNGSYYNCGYNSQLPFANVSYDLYRFTLNDNMILPATYNYNETIMEHTLHNTSTITSLASYFKIQLLNVSNSSAYGFYEVMLNITSGSETPLSVYYCNSTYTSGAVVSSSNCVQFGTISTPNTYNHTHSVNSSHHLIPFSISGGNISTVKVTSLSYFLIRGVNAHTITLYGLNGSSYYSRPNVLERTGGGGGSWTDISTTLMPDSHLHQFSSDSTLYYYAQGNNTNDGILYNSSILYDVLDLGGLPPNAPSIHNPVDNGLYSGIININYTLGASPMGLDVNYSNITLLNYPAHTFNLTITANNSILTNYSWNSTLATDGSYTIRVWNCDTTMRCSFSEVDNVTIDNTKPSITITSPAVNYTYYNTHIVPVTGNITDVHPATQWWTNNSGVTNNTLSLSGTNYNINLESWAEGLTTITIYANDSANNKNSNTRKFFVDTTPPTINSTYPAEDNSSWKYSYQSVNFNNSCYTPNNISQVKMTCYNSTADLVFSDTITGLSTYQTYNYLNTTNTINYQDTFTCQAECGSLSSFYNITEDYKIFVIDTLSWENYTNLTQTKLNDDFAFDVTYNFNGDNHRCFAYTNSSAVSCNSSIGTGTLSLGCTISASTQQSISMYLDCSDLDMGIYNVTPVDTKVIFIDITKPEINIYSPVLVDSNVRLKNNSVFNWNVSITDSNVFGFEINCSKSGITQYYDRFIDINSTSFSYTNSTYFQNPGLYNCNISASDDHTDNDFKEQSKLNDKGIDNLLTGKIKGNVGKVDFELSNEDNMEVQLLKKTDRVSLEMKFDNLDKKTKTKIVKLKCEDGYELYKRSTNPKYKEHWVCVNGINGYWTDGNTIENDVSVSSYVDKKTGELVYEYTTNGNKITMNSIGGLNFNSILFNISIDYWENVSFYAYNIYNGSNIYNFNINVTNSTGSSNLYTTSTGNMTLNLLNGTYTIIQNATNYLRTQSYSYNTGNISSYNKSFWQAELTASIRNIQDDSLVGGTTLTIQNDSILYTNTTNPATFLLNSGTDYILNVTGSGITPNSTNYTITSNGIYTYTFYVYANFTLFIKDEATKDTFNISSPSSLQQYIFCEDNTIIITDVTSNSTSFTAPCVFTKIKYIVNYPTDRYYRTLLPRAFNLTTGNISVWLINLDTTQTVFNTWELFALNEEFDNVRVYFKKFIDTEEFIITSDYLDVEDKIGTYLMLGEEYTIEIEADNLATRSLGFYSADAAGDKVLRLFDVYYNPTDLAGYYLNNSWYVSVDNTTDPKRVKVSYLSTDVDTATLTVYNESISGTMLYTTTASGDSGIIYYTPSVAYENYTFLVELNITKTDGTSSNTTFTKLIKTNARIALDLITFGYITDEWLFMFVAILLSVVALSFSIPTANVGGIIFIGLGGLFYWLGWFYISTGVLSLAVIIAVGSFIKNKDIGAE